MNTPNTDPDEAKEPASAGCMARLVRLSDAYWKPWFAELLELAAKHGITTSDDADLWWDDCGAGKTPQESMDSFLASDEGAEFRNFLPNAEAMAAADNKTPTKKTTL